MLRIRTVEALFGVGFAVLSAIALARAADLFRTACAIGMMVYANWTGRTLPDVFVPRDALLRHFGIGFTIVVIGLVADAAGGDHALDWASIVMAFCAGNRLKAAGVRLLG